jgi:hypothetical protein
MADRASSKDQLVSDPEFKIPDDCTLVDRFNRLQSSVFPEAQQTYSNPNSFSLDALLDSVLAIHHDIQQISLENSNFTRFKNRCTFWFPLLCHTVTSLSRWNSCALRVSHNPTNWPSIAPQFPSTFFFPNPRLVENVLNYYHGLRLNLNDFEIIQKLASGAFGKVSLHISCSIIDQRDSDTHVCNLLNGELQLLLTCAIVGQRCL